MTAFPSFLSLFLYSPCFFRPAYGSPFSPFPAPLFRVPVVYSPPCQKPLFELSPSPPPPKTPTQRGLGNVSASPPRPFYSPLRISVGSPPIVYAPPLSLDTSPWPDQVVSTPQVTFFFPLPRGFLCGPLSNWRSGSPFPAIHFSCYPPSA